MIAVGGPPIYHTNIIILAPLLKQVKYHVRQRSAGKGVLAYCMPFQTTRAIGASVAGVYSVALTRSDPRLPVCVAWTAANATTDTGRSG